MKVIVLYFAAARERAGVDRETLELPVGATVRALAETIAGRHPRLAGLLDRLRFAVNQEFASSDQLLRDGDEAALIPPVAGGAGLFKLSAERLRLDEVVEAVSGAGRGGIVTFSGTVRAESHGKKVLRLEYEAYAPMAEAKLVQIGREAEERWPGTRVAIVHRVGSLEVGEAAVLIAAAAPRRAEAFRACEHAIERLKQDVPIWKKEVFEDGSAWVGLGP